MRLTKRGFSVVLAGTLRARSGKVNLQVVPSGLCWSSADPSDSILPMIPDLLSFPKAKVRAETLGSMYFTLSDQGRGLSLRTRLESHSVWDKLRASGNCGLAPDEHTVASFLLRTATGKCEMVTDFSTAASIPKTYGRTRFFITELDRFEAACTIRAVGEKAAQNSYLPRDPGLKIEGQVEPHLVDLVELYNELGEWCYFAPAHR